MARPLALAALPLAVVLIAATPPGKVTSLPGYEAPEQPWRSVEDAAARKACLDRIEHVRAAGGKPRLEREPATADKPMHYYAVDQRMDDCPVLVPVADPADLRSPPEPGTPAVIPAQPGQ